ncbi:MAG: tRNA (adenosine(37)-N6)-dimethylallyltransferase MiaA [Bdellovibrionales bacterium]|nr:tRNA (adenosine(37)-N6)-dimethylallyltransferase MiaA [Bdellovibrionales bacterium]
MVPASRLNPPAKRVAILTGTTASGKTAAALEFCRRHREIEIVNADSLLVFRGFDIGTAKPSVEELAEIPHHLIDIRDPDELYTAGDFVRDCEAALADVHSRGKRALIVGGTGFYLKAMLYGLWDAPKAPPELRKKLESRSNQELYDELFAVDEEAALRITRNDRYRLIRAAETMATTGKTPTALEAEASARPAIKGLSLFVTDREPEALKARIAARTDAMIAAGFLDEVSRLLKEFPGVRPFDSVGYAEAVAYLEGRPPEGRRVAEGIAGLKDEIRLATHQLAKRQRTFFKGQFKSRPGSPAGCGGERSPDLKFFRLDEDRGKLVDALEEIYG